MHCTLFLQQEVLLHEEMSSVLVLLPLDEADLLFSFLFPLAPAPRLSTTNHSRQRPFHRRRQDSRRLPRQGRRFPLPQGSRKADLLEDRLPRRIRELPPSRRSDSLHPAGTSQGDGLLSRLALADIPTRS